MNIYRTLLFATSLFIGTGLVLVCAVTVPLRAQSKRTLPNQTDTIAGRDIESRERQMRKIEADNKKERDPKEVLVEVNQDLGRLKELREGILPYTIAPGNTPNYIYVSESLAEIRTRAIRLRASLALPKAEGDKNAYKNADKEDLAPALGTLNKLLDGFLHNPIFSDTGAIDPQLAAKAGRDLDDLIVLSEKLRKNVDKRSKSNK